MSINIERDYVAPGVSLLIIVFLIPLTSFILRIIHHIPYLKSIQNEYTKRKTLCDLYKVLTEFICLLLIVPCIIDFFKNIDSTNVNEWDLDSYIYLQWALWLTLAIYLYEMLTLGIRTTDSKQFMHDLAHWIHHSMHIFIVCYVYFFTDSVTYFALRLAVVYAFWTFIASIPISFSIIRYFTAKSPKEMYYIYLFNSYLFGIGNIIRCTSGIIVYIIYFNQFETFIKIIFIPGVLCWSIDQVFTSLTLRKMANEQYEQMKSEQVEAKNAALTPGSRSTAIESEQMEIVGISN